MPVAQWCLQRGEAEEGGRRERDLVQLLGLRPEGCVAKVYQKAPLGLRFLVCKIKLIRNPMQPGGEAAKDGEGWWEGERSKGPTNSKHTQTYDVVGMTFNMMTQVIHRYIIFLDDQNKHVCT